MALAGCGAELPEGDDDAATVVGYRGAFDFAVTPLAPPAAGPNTFELRLQRHGTDDPLQGAELRVRAVMPSMGHEATTEPTVEEIAPGLYQIAGVVFTMPGTWEVRYRAERAAIHDEAAFRYLVR